MSENAVQPLLTVLLIGSMLAVSAMIIMGVCSLFTNRQDDFAKNRWMRLRILFQALALLIFALLLWIR